MQFFTPSNDTTESDMDESIIDSMNKNARENDNDSPADNVDPYKEIHQPFKNKSSWKPDPPQTEHLTHTREHSK